MRSKQFLLAVRAPNKTSFLQQRPDCVLGDRGYDAEAIRQGLRDRRIIPFLARRNTEHASGLGRWRWVVERTFAWLNQFRRLRVRYEQLVDFTRHSCPWGAL
jgi:transposase